jgi:hypothetical protein
LRVHSLQSKCIGHTAGPAAVLAAAVVASFSPGALQAVEKKIQTITGEVAGKVLSRPEVIYAILSYEHTCRR